MNQPIRNWAPPTTGFNLYFMIFPDPAAVRRIARTAAELKHAHGLVGRPRPAELLHMTMHPLGWDPERPVEILDAAKRAALDVAAPPFDVTLDRALSFSGERPPFVLSCGNTGPLTDLAALMATAVQRSMPWLRRWRFWPHMTLLYDRKRVGEARLEEPITFRVNEFALVNSLHGQSRYEYLGRWPLRARDDQCR